MNGVFMKISLFVSILCLFEMPEILAQNDINGLSAEIIEIIDSNSFSETDTGAVIYLREAKMKVEEDGLFSVEYHIIGQIMDDKAKEDYSQIPMIFNSYYEDVTLDYARTVDLDKSFIEVSKDAIQIKTLPDYYGLNTYTDSKILTFSLPALKPGKLFEYKLTYKITKTIIGNYWFESFSFNNILRSLKDPYYLRVDPVKISRFVLDVKENELFNSEILNADISEEVTSENSNKKYTWEMQDVPTFTIESYMPYLYEVIPVLTISSIPDWKTFGSWIQSVTSPRIKFSDQIQNLANELTANAILRNEKIEIIYDYVRNEIDYIQADLDRGGLTPHFCDDVLRTKYGDCKDQATLLIALLKALNIEAFPALINTYSYRDLQNYLPTQYFDHMIVFVPSDSSELWLDPTAELDNFPNLISADQDRWALVIDDNNSHFIKTPSASMQDNRGIFQLVTNRQKDTLKALIKVESFGVFNDYISSYLDYYSSYENDKYYKETVESYYYQVAKVEECRSIKEESDNESHKQLISIKLIQPTSEYSIFEYQSAIDLALTFFYVTLPFEEERKFDLIFPFKYVIKGNEVFKSPWDHASIKDIPQSDSIGNKYFTYKQTFAKYNDSVMVNWEFALKENFIPKEDYDSFYKDILEFEEMLDWKINFRKPLDFPDLVSNISSYYGVDAPSGYEGKEYVPPRYPNDLNINSGVKKKIENVIKDYIYAVNDGDKDEVLKFISKENDEGRILKEYSKSDLRSLGASVKVENINIIDVIYDYAVVTYTMTMDFKNYSQIGPIRLEYLSIMNQKNNRWKIYRSRLKNYVDNCTVYATIAYAYYNKQEYDKALIIFDLAKANDSTCVSALGNIGWIYFLKGKYQKCIDFSEEAVQLDSTALYAQYNIALGFLCLGETEKARTKYEQTIKLNKALGEEIHKGAIADLKNLIKDNFKKKEAEAILTELFEYKNDQMSTPAKKR